MVEATTITPQVGPLRQVDAGLLNVGCAEAGPGDGRVAVLPQRMSLRRRSPHHERVVLAGSRRALARRSESLAPAVDHLSIKVSEVNFNPTLYRQELSTHPSPRHGDGIRRPAGCWRCWPPSG
jgi:hypothetical protein